MKEDEKKAFDSIFGGAIGANQKMWAKVGWKKGIEWFESQVHEPVFVVGSAGLRLYTNPTARLNEDILKVLEGFCSLIRYQYTGSEEAMSALQEADNQAQKVLKILKEHKK